tara:strand:- start:476 stop:598 length:123 start_codon:yes stop_codon:yes gene_type:complete
LVSDKAKENMLKVKNVFLVMELISNDLKELLNDEEKEEDP